MKNLSKRERPDTWSAEYMNVRSKQTVADVNTLLLLLLLLNGQVNLCEGEGGDDNNDTDVGGNEDKDGDLDRNEEEDEDGDEDE